MMDRPTSRRQFDLLVHAGNALEPSRVPAKIRGEVTLLLKLLMAECVAAGAVLPVEAADE